MEEIPVLSFRYSTKKGEKKSRKENLVDFVKVKGWKAMGNKLGNYIHISSLKWVVSDSSSEAVDEKGKMVDDLTLFT